MSQDVVADALNQIMNAKRVEKKEIIIGRKSKLLLAVFERMKKEGYLDYRENEDGRSVTVEVLKLNVCRAVKPRYFVKAGDVEKYSKRFLPSRRFGKLIVSTNEGLMDQHEVVAKKIGGALVAYVY